MEACHHLQPAETEVIEILERIFLSIFSSIGDDLPIWAYL
jgi:hypothetical protein